MPAEHLQLYGLAQGYYCGNCGGPGMNMYGMPHQQGPFGPASVYSCQPDPDLVRQLDDLNQAEDLSLVREVMMRHAVNYWGAVAMVRELEGDPARYVEALRARREP